MAFWRLEAVGAELGGGVMVGDCGFAEARRATSGVKGRMCALSGSGIVCGSFKEEDIFQFGLPQTQRNTHINKMQ